MFFPSSNLTIFVRYLFRDVLALSVRKFRVRVEQRVRKLLRDSNRKLNQAKIVNGAKGAKGVRLAGAGAGQGRKDVKDVAVTDKRAGSKSVHRGTKRSGKNSRSRMCEPPPPPGERAKAKRKLANSGARGVSRMGQASDFHC